MTHGTLTRGIWRLIAPTAPSNSLLTLTLG
jgi:hypothetical protein